MIIDPNDINKIKALLGASAAIPIPTYGKGLLEILHTINAIKNAPKNTP